MGKRIDIGHWSIEPSPFGGNVLRGVRRGTGERIACAVFAIWGRGDSYRWRETHRATTDLGRPVRLLGEGQWRTE
jgi:hypothetical protein